MQDEIQIILQAILDEQKETRNDIKEIRSEMSTKDDLKELNSQIDAQVEKCQIVKIANDKNTEYRETSIGFGRWIGVSIVTLILGALVNGTIANAHSNVQTVVVKPAIVDSVHPNTIVPPMPDKHN